MDLFNLLLREQFYVSNNPIDHSEGFEEKPLFSSQKALATELSNDEAGRALMDKSAITLRPTINRLLKPGSDPNHREMTDDYKNGILTLIKEKLHPSDPRHERIDQIFHSATKELKDVTVTTTIENDDIDSFIQWSDQTFRGIVLIDDPGEKYYYKEKADSFELLSRLFESVDKNFDEPLESVILSKLKGKNYQTRTFLGIPKYSLTYYVPSYEVAFDQWYGLFSFFLENRVLKNKNQPNKETIHYACQALELLNDQENQLLQISTISPAFTYSPFVYMEKIGLQGDMKTPQLERVAFHLKVDEGRLKKVLRLFPHEVDNWAKHFYPLLLQKNPILNLDEVKFEFIKHQVIEKYAREKMKVA